VTFNQKHFSVQEDTSKEMNLRPRSAVSLTWESFAINTFVSATNINDYGMPKFGITV
jgi:hypothetical protein